MSRLQHYSREGAQQSYQLSKVICCVAEHQTIEKLEAQCNLDYKLWIADHGSPYGKTDQILLAVAFNLVAEETTVYRANKSKSSIWNLWMNVQRFALLGCQLAVDAGLAVDADGTPVPDIVPLGACIGSTEFASDELLAMMDEMEWRMALLRIPQLAHHLLRQMPLRPMPHPCSSYDTT
jgi:hypothetical protein